VTSNWMLLRIIRRSGCHRRWPSDLAVLRAGSTGRILPTTPLAPSTVGTWLRSLTFGHVRQLDRLTELLLARAWAAGAGPGDGDLVIDVDPTDL